MFTGFTDETVDFMWGIRFNNERSWFEAHKEIYLEHFYRPMTELADEIEKQVDERGVESLFASGGAGSSDRGAAPAAREAAGGSLDVRSALARPRRQEILACVNRYRKLMV